MSVAEPPDDGSGASIARITRQEWCAAASVDINKKCLAMLYQQCYTNA